MHPWVGLVLMGWWKGGVATGVRSWLGIMGSVGITDRVGGHM